MLTAGGCALVTPMKETAAPAATGASVLTPGPKRMMAPLPNQANTPVPDGGAGAKEALLHSGTGTFVKQTPPTVAPASGPEDFWLNFEAADIRAVIQSIMVDNLRESVTIDPATTGTVTIRLSKAVSKKDLIPILEMLLRQNGQIMLREEGLYKVMPAVKGIKGSVTPQVGVLPSALPPGFSVQIVQLKYVGAADMVRILTPYATDPSTLQLDAVRNLIILSGTQRELKHLLEIIDLFDVDFLAGYSVGLFQMSTDVKALSADLDRIFGTAAQSPLAGIVRIIPIERMNGLLVVTTQPRYLDEAKKWIDRLDKSGGGAGGLRLNVYSVQHGKAEKLAQLLSEIYGNKQGGSGSPTLAPGQRPAQIGTTPQATTGQPGQPPVTPAQSALQSLISFASSGVSVSKDVRIIADNDNNSLLILASPSDYETILTALRQLDVPRRQVSVEVLVAEVVLTDDLKFGIEWFINARNNTVGALRNPTGGSLSPVLPALPDLAGKVPLAAVTATPGLQLINVAGTDIRAVLQALGSDGRSKVISTPRVMVLDNEKASINVGQQISVDTGSSTGTGTGGNVVTTRQYLSTGVILSVTPRINAGGRVTLDVNQEVSSPTTDSGTANPTINTRKATTVVTVGSGETMVLAGLIQEIDGIGSSGVPLISKIPLIGGLFGSQSYNKRRTELVLLVTPTVVTTSEDSRAITEEIRRKLPSLQSYIPKTTN
ncbi:MAG: type II secretion system secretin GspD [Betaproteobacteria bacterium]|nr:type II secretion system secretin GspD [Betaproteobacteria bacterium]